MPGPNEEEIRTRAYKLWQEAGQPHGEMDNFWYRAEKELLVEKCRKGEKCIPQVENG
ncbi:DUF2934 domain-containing protein [Bradyrhizobium sp. 33ap4]|uniref:DUF2934 domain-containing protein n=1 Tax=Bradyrhizobium sp. 33ap4 TaxID=3061630 RepID=UPI00292DFCDF|nr:DUF2934 domain-containing protein [Bradyrhizobium sp. 33ap4]